MCRVFPLLAVLLAAAGCVPAVEPPPTLQASRPDPVVQVPPASPIRSDWRDWPVTPGTWRYRQGESGLSAAIFGPATGGYLVRLECDARQRRVTLAMAGGPGAPPLTLRTSTTTRTVATVATDHAGASPPATRDAVLAATDPLLDAMAFSRGHFTIEEAGRPPLVIPAWPEIGRVIEDCRA